MARKQRAAQDASTKPTSTPPAPVFPQLSDKEYLECTELIPDQILLIEDVLSAEECKSFVRFIDGLPLELTPPKKRGEADRVNYRTSITSLAFAQRLQDILLPHLPDFPSPASAKRAADAGARKPCGMNSNIRMYKYETGQYFGAHYDDSIRDTASGARSEWTLLIYLTGIEDGVKGGETLFHNEQRGRPKEVITPSLKRGMALLHRHGNECMLHEGSPVLAGTKYVLRSDLLFKS